jgi:hypothetical protein
VPGGVASNVRRRENTNSNTEKVKHEETQKVREIPNRYRDTVTTESVSGTRNLSIIMGIWDEAHTTRTGIYSPPMS